MASKTSALQSAMMAKLQGAQFRQLNEKLYTQSSDDSFRMMKKEPRLFEVYHAGYRAQVSGWPINPLDIIIDELRTSAPGTVIADMGCGEARLAATLAPVASAGQSTASQSITVHSFDLVAPAGNPYIIACDTSHTPLPPSSVDVVVFCLSLMGTNYAAILTEADRILKPSGRILVAEVRSRFEGPGQAVEAGPPPKVGLKRPRPAEAGSESGSGANGITRFVDGMRGQGFKLTRRDESNTMFVLMFFRRKDAPGQGPSERSGPSSSSSSSTAAGGPSGKGKQSEHSQGGGAEQKSKKKRSKHNKYKQVHGETSADGGEGDGIAGAGSGMPLLKACVYKKR